MKNYKYNKYIKVGFLICIILTIALFFYINNIIQEQLEEDKNQLKKDISLQITSIIDNYSREYISFNPQKMQEMYNVIDLLEIPVIIKSSVKGESGETCELFNIDLDNKGKCTNEVNQKLSIMKTHFEPKLLSNMGEQTQVYLYYGNSSTINNIKGTINNLKWIPYIEIGFVVIICLLVMFGLNIMNRSENNLIYVGMARETAHQLGTPISSLMGWVEMLSNNKKDKEFIIKSMNEDLEHLKNISHKFNKIGKNPKFEKIDLEKIIFDIIDYFETRIPESKNIKINLDKNVNKKYFIDGDSLLIYWCIENLIKNSIESIIGNKGNINIKLINTDDKYIDLFIEDNGDPISREQKNKIFKPGYSTKNKGWGIGLSLSERIIKYIHKGSINLVHSNENTTLFNIRFKNSYS